MLLQAFELFALVGIALGEKVVQPVTPYITPFEFCSKLSPGSYCNPSFPRSYVSCPNGLERLCPPNNVCTVGETTGSIDCVPNLWNPVNQLCLGRPTDTSFCFQNMTVECDAGEMFLCPSDLACKRRGRRAYCVQPQFLQSEPTSGFCAGLNRPGKVCHPLNLKRIISCPDEEVQVCGLGQMCVVQGDAANATCADFDSDLRRFCSNKPLHSSFCFNNSGGRFVSCSNDPQIVECPSGRCRQNFGITAECVPSQ